MQASDDRPATVAMPSEEAGVQKEDPRESSEYKLRKQLLLLAALVVSVTYIAGLNPPGGVWQRDGPALAPAPAPADAGSVSVVVAGGPVLRLTHRRRFLSFHYCNSTALAASLVVIFLLLLKNPNRVQLAVLRLVMVLDLLGLMGAYLAGSCRDKPATVYATALVLALSAYVGVHILQGLSHDSSPSLPADEEEEVMEEEEDQEEDHRPRTVILRPKERRKVLLLLATFATAITYVAGLNLPGGFWNTFDDGQRRGGAGGGHGHRYRPGESLVEAHHGGHLRMFFYCNTTAFVASLFIIVLLLHPDKKNKLTASSTRSFALHVFVLGSLLGLMAAYDAGRCRDTDCSVYVVSLFGAVLAFIFLTMLVIISVKGLSCVHPRNHAPAPAAESSSHTDSDHRVDDDDDHGSQSMSSPPPPPATSSPNGQAGGVSSTIIDGEAVTIHLEKKKAIKKVKSLILLLANLATTITYQAGLDPPGGFWPEDGEGHHAGDAILLSKDPARYKAFFYCNSTAFAVSLVVILMVQKEKLVKSHTLLVAMTLDMFALIGAYAAGSCRDLRTSVHVVALAGAILVYVLVHVLLFTLGSTDVDARVPEKKHKRLLLVAILVATITYQVGLTPPGGFWNEDDDGRRHAGDAVLLDKYPRRFKAFFYSNTVSLMASIALILLLVNPILSRLAIRCYALYACQVAGLFGLMAAYAAGSARKLRTSIFVCVLIAAVIAFVLVNTVMLTFFKSRMTARADDHEAATSALPSSSMAQQQPRHARETEYRDEVYAKRKYLMLLGILAASVTYQAGLAPPGGLWQDDGGAGTRRRREAGNPVLHDTDPRRYHVFFYSNSTSFVASIVTIALLLQQILRRHRPTNHKLLLLATNTALVLDLLGLLVAYAAGSTREWGNVAVLPLLVLLFMAIHVAVWLFGERRRCAAGDGGGASTSNGRTGQQLESGQHQSSHVQVVV